jgi:S1-C subfamily serine protease
MANEGRPGAPHSQFAIRYSPFAIPHSQFLGHVVVAVLLAAQMFSTGNARGASPSNLVLRTETRRIETIERIAPSVVCIYDSHQRGGGSGVLIDPDGYGLTNYHVVAGLLETRTGWGGLADGVLYELQVLGIDVTGDVAMFRLIPPKAQFRFPYARLGDSDAVKVGDPAIAIGNPFSLSEDHTPSVSVGIVTGIHRYQKGVGGNLAYTDSIQVDAAINPGNSGGPLFNAAGEIIGINGRISVNTRGRYNVGFGYAISSNQIKRFIPALRAGLLARHGTWQATVDDNADGVRFAEVRRSGPAYDAGVRVGDRLLSLDGVAIKSANQVASILGTYPVNWPVRLQIERPQRKKTDAPSEIVVRLEAPG